MSFRKTKGKVTVILPCYNEEKNVGNVISKLILLKKRGIISDIIAVDDGSRDETKEIIKKYGIKAIYHKSNMGKGKSMQDGARLAIKEGSKHLVFMDADMQHDPLLIPQLLKPLLKGEVDFVIGSRYKKRPSMVLTKRLLMNQVFASLINRLFGTEITDPFCGFRAIKAGAYKKINPKNKGYGIEIEKILKAKTKKIRFTEVHMPPIYFKDKISEEHKETSITALAKWLDYNINVINKVIKEEKFGNKLKFK